MVKVIKVEWCENFIRAQFRKHSCKSFECKGIEANLMFDMAAKAGLYERGTYGSSFSQALANTVDCEAVQDVNGNFAYHCFRLKEVTA